MAMVGRMLERIPDWSSDLAEKEMESEIEALQKHLRTGRPLGEMGFIGHSE